MRTNPVDNQFAKRWPTPAVLARAKSWMLAILSSVMLVCLACSLAGAGQEPGEVGWQAPTTNPFPGIEDMDPQLAHRQLRALNAQRQKEIVADTAKLLKLAQALNAQTRTESAESLSAEQWKEIDRIEKLAHSVRQKMIETYGGGPIFRPPLVPIIR